MNTLTRHAATRCQQRGLPPMLLDVLMQCGSSVPAGDGAVKVFIDKAARRRIKVYAGPLASTLHEYLDVYAIVAADGQVITAAHRTERIRRH